MSKELIKIKFLLIEDNAQIFEWVQEALKTSLQYQFEILHAPSLGQGLGLLNQNEIAGIILDINLPDSRGIATFETVMKASIGKPVVVLTGEEEQTLADKVIKGGAQDFLVKGNINSQVLLRVVHYALERTKVLLEIQESKEELAKEKTRLNSIFNHSIDGTIILSEQGIIQFLNLAAQNLLGRRPEELIGSPFGFPIVVDEYSELTILRKDKSFAEVEMRVVKIDWENKPCYLASLRDITERKRLEDQLVSAQKMESIGRLASGVAHDFNNLLTVINGYSDILMEQTDVLDKKHFYLREVRGAGTKAAELTRQLLAFSRRQVVSPKVIDLNKLILNSSKMLGRLLGEGVELVTVLAPELMKVKVDPSQMEQVIMNLVVNARDAMPDGGKLFLETWNGYLNKEFCDCRDELEPGNYVVLKVRDTGEGIPIQVRRHIFEPFFTTKKNDKGTGLGLATCYGIIKMSNGLIEVASQEGWGTEFKVFLPQSEDEDIEEVKKVDDNVDLTGKETVLLVEDDAAIRQLTKKILQNYGYNVLEASNGEHALRVVKDRSKKALLHILLTDVVMPLMDGKTLAENIIKITPDIKIVYMSGYAAEYTNIGNMIDENKNFIQKPFSADELVKKIRSILDSKGEGSNVS